MFIVSAVWAVACSSSTSTTAVENMVGPPASLTAVPASRDDVQVATVNGRPVYGSCVATQAGRGASRQEALDQCIAFELLAQRAEAYATDPEVIAETRTALVNQLVTRDYENKLTKPADFGAFWDKALERNKRLVDHGEARASAYARITVASEAPADEQARAKALAEEIAAATRDERGLTASHLEDIAKQVVGSRGKVDFAVVPPYLDEGGLDPTYAKPLFAIPEVGRTSAAVRTPWGWDVILFSERIAAEKLSQDEIVAKVLPDVKRSYFVTWANQIASKLSVKIYDENIPLLEDL